jgi:hypothetical protein
VCPASTRPIVIDDGFDPHRGLVTLFKTYPVLWKRVSAAVASVLPEQVERPFERVRFCTKDIIGRSYRPSGIYLPSLGDR